MRSLTFFFAEVVALYLLSGKIHSEVQHGILKITRASKFTLYLFSALFLPGIVLHEISHYITAIALFVPVYGFSVLPVREKDRIRLGSVRVKKTDFIRRFFVSTSPLFFGLGVIVAGSNYALGSGIYRDWRLLILAGYLIFVITNTMFLSRADMSGTWQFLTVILIITLMMIYFRIDFGKASGLTGLFVSNAGKINLFLLIPITLDIIALTILFKFNENKQI